MSSAKKGFEGTKTPRADTTREKTARRKPWAPSSSLDAPPAPEGYKHRWIRSEARGFVDTKNVQQDYEKDMNWYVQTNILILRLPWLIQVNMKV